MNYLSWKNCHDQLLLSLVENECKMSPFHNLFVFKQFISTCDDKYLINDMRGVTQSIWSRKATYATYRYIQQIFYSIYPQIHARNKLKCARSYAVSVVFFFLSTLHLFTWFESLLFDILTTYLKWNYKNKINFYQIKNKWRLNSYLL